MRVVQEIVEVFRQNWVGHVGFGTIIPRPKDNKFMAAKVKAYNQELMAWCAQNGCVCLRSHGPFLKGGRPKRELFDKGQLHLGTSGRFPSGVYILRNFLQSELAPRTLTPRMRKAETDFYAS